jgi:hypothetical protein
LEFHGISWDFAVYYLHLMGEFMGFHGNVSNKNGDTGSTRNYPPEIEEFAIENGPCLN